MSNISLILAFALAMQAVVGQQGCYTRMQRRSWTSLSPEDKAKYIRADQCLMNTPPQYGIPGAKSIWEELQYAHIRNMNWIHGVSQFLFWHRYYVTTYERLMNRHCDWQGGVPYWQISVDADSILSSPVWDANLGVGGNGAGGNGCIQDGPFRNLTLHFTQDGNVGPPYCLTRSINAETFRGSAQRFVDECVASPTFAEAHVCYEGFVHASAHDGTGGVVDGECFDSSGRSHLFPPSYQPGPTILGMAATQRNPSSRCQWCEYAVRGIQSRKWLDASRSGVHTVLGR